MYDHRIQPNRRRSAVHWDQQSYGFSSKATQTYHIFTPIQARNPSRRRGAPTTLAPSHPISENLTSRSVAESAALDALSYLHR